MTDTCLVRQLNETYVHITCPDWMAAEISDHFSFKLASAKFHPAYKAKAWDGVIRLFNVFTRQLYKGLVPALVEFCERMTYDVQLEESSLFADQEVSEVELDSFFQKLKNKGLWPKFEIASDQRAAVMACFRRRRVSMLSPTGSGKSFLIYLNCWWWKRKTLIVVPRVGLAKQMYSDLISYGMPPEYMHIVAEGSEKSTKAPIVISTWQSIYKLPAKYFQQYEVLIGDEVHGFKATSLTSIATKCTNAFVRIGLTGTFDDEQSQTNTMVIKGLFGNIYRAATTAELQEKGRLAQLQIKCIVLEYDQEHRKELKKQISAARKTSKSSASDYQLEIKYLIENNPRNRFITNLACSLKGTTLLLFRRTDSHAKVVYEMIKEKASLPVYYIDGKVDADDREEIRLTVIEGEGSIICASYGTTSTGINIPNIDNVIFASPSRSKITVLQSIGRALRLAEGKSHATLYDIADNLSVGDTENYGIMHLEERLKLYVQEQFSYKLYNVALKKE